MQIKPTKRGKTLATITIGTLLTGAAITAFTLEPHPWDDTTTPTETTTTIDVSTQAWTPDELLMTCDNDYEQGSEAWEGCVDYVLTATCMFEPFTEDSEFYSSADARCLGGRVTSETPVISNP